MDKAKRSISYVHENKYDKYVGVLLVFAGISGAFDRAVGKNLGDHLTLITILGICIILGELLGWISNYLYSALISWTGKWLNGKADTISILRILAYASTPSILALILLIPQIGIYGLEVFKEEGDTTSGSSVIIVIFFGSLTLEMILGIVSIIFSVIGISEVQNFEIGKAILNLILPAIIIMGPILFLVFIASTF